MTNFFNSPHLTLAFRGSLALLCALCFYVVNVPAQDWRTVADGVEYAEVRREFSGKPVNINLLRLDLKKVRLDVHHAMDAAIGTEKTSSIATRHKAFAAINAGFFRLDTSIWAGDAAGVLVIDGRVISESISNRTALLLFDRPSETSVMIEPVKQVIGIFGSIAKGRGLRIDATGINRERKKEDIVVYTPEFHHTTLTQPGGTEIVVRNGRCSLFLKGMGSTTIPSDGFVISAGEDRVSDVEPLAKCDSRLSLDTALVTLGSDGQTRFLFNSGVRGDLVAGVPRLIKNSKIDITWEQEKSSKAFVETRHPRTAVAKLKDGKFLMLTADGRSEQSAGLDLYDLAAYFLELGATDAMNLDGGGSTTMFLDGKVVNKPSDKEGERKVSDAILVTLRKPVSKKRN